MMCDYGDDFGDDGFEDDGSMDDEPFEPEYDEHDNPDDDFSSEADSAEPCGPGWKDIAFFGAMSEALAMKKAAG